ncbi:hypothetical protein V8G54_032257 [Vigna mungo]|uniref:Uncharacterized protein n=1 Tax=Vigna mungo TaxID=3915 RepID=A0AAQ3MM34_VIGMU
MGFQYWTIAQIWPRGFCAAHNVCDPSKAKLLKFTIHGLWPSNYSPMQDPFWCSSTALNVSLISGIINELDQDWPNYLGNNENFWNHEWKKHENRDLFPCQFIAGTDMVRNFRWLQGECQKSETATLPSLHSATAESATLSANALSPLDCLRHCNSPPLDSTCLFNIVSYNNIVSVGHN